jgi:hypothetical protein
MAEKNKGGRPPIYKDVEDFAAKIDEYFEWVKGEYVDEQIVNVITLEPEFIKRWIREPERVTLTGLALFLGFESRQSLQDYKKKPKFSYPLKRALTRVEQQYENFLFERNSTGAIFALKNFGWTDKSQVDVDHTSKGESIVWQETKTYVDRKDAE